MFFVFVETFVRAFWAIIVALILPLRLGWILWVTTWPVVGFFVGVLSGFAGATWLVGQVMATPVKWPWPR